jgi:biopolymer transport protein ExbD
MSIRLDHGEDTLDEVHEIIVTPFIDVMLLSRSARLNRRGRLRIPA